MKTLFRYPILSLSLMLVLLLGLLPLLAEGENAWRAQAAILVNSQGTESNADTGVLDGNNNPGRREFIDTGLHATAKRDNSHVAAVEMRRAQEEVSLDLVGELGGAHDALAVQGDYVFLGSGASLAVLDISDKSHPRQVASVGLAEAPWDIFSSSNYAYVAGAGGTFYTVDISQPLSPTLVVSRTLSDAMLLGVHVADDYAYVAAQSDGLIILDVSNPISPTAVFTLNVTAEDVFVQGDRAYVLKQQWPDSQLLVLDVTHPTNPTPLGSTATRGRFPRLFVRGDYAYVANGRNKGIQIVDVSDPTNPTVVGSYGDGDKNGLDVAAYGGSTYVYVAGAADGLMVLDASDPANPIEKKVLPDVEALRLAVGDSHLYTANAGDIGFQAFDLSNPETPQAGGQVESPGTLFSLIVSGDHLYLSTWDRLWAYSLTDPTHPTPQGSYEQWKGTTLFAQGDYLYALSSNGLNILDASDPSHLTQTGVYSPTRRGALFALGNYVYLLPPTSLEIVDVSTPSVPTKVGELGGLHFAADLFVTQGSTIAYIVDENGLHTVDASDPANPQELASVRTWGEPAAVWVWNNIAFVGSNQGSNYPNLQFIIEAFNVADPAHPAKVAQTNPEAGNIGDLKVHEGTVYAAIASFSGLYTYEYASGPGFTVGPRFTFPGGLTGLSVYVPSASLAATGLQQTGTTAYIYGKAESKGMKIIRHGPPVWCLRTAVSPPEAADEGCTAEPKYTEGARGSQVWVTAHENADNGWNFLKWTGAASGSDNPAQATMNGRVPNCSVATAHFVKPTLTLSGGGHETSCPAEDVVGTPAQDVTILPIGLCANDADSWQLDSLTFQTFGGGDEAVDVARAKLYEGNRLLQTVENLTDNGDITFSQNLPLIPSGGCVHLTLKYDFSDAVLQPSIRAREFNAKINMAHVNARPLFLANYVKLPQPSTYVYGGARLARILNVSQGLGYDTIQQGVSHATSGDTIEVCPGEYHENVPVDKKLTIRSRDGYTHTTVIAADSHKDVFELVVPNITLEGFTIQGGKDGVDLSRADNSQLRSNYIKHNASDGVGIHSSDQVIVSGNKIAFNGKDGVYLFFADNCMVHDNTIFGNRDDGVELALSSRNYIANFVSGNSGAGIELEGSHHNLIGDPGDSTSDSIVNNFVGIVLDGSDGNIIRDVAVNDNETQGILLLNSHGNWITTDNPQKSYARVIHNGFWGSGFSGIELIESKNTRIYGVVISHNGLDGIEAGNFKDGISASGTRIRSCQICDNEEFGIYLALSPGSVVSYNQICDNKGSGLVIHSGGERYKIRGNHIRGNGPSTGIYMNAAGGEIVGNSISAEKSDGIKTANGADPTITDNNLFDNDGYALNNLSPLTTTVSAPHNWWGDPSGPGGEGPGSGDEVSAGVTFTPWRTEPVSLVASVAEDPVLAGRGMTVTNEIFLRTWDPITDTLEVSLTDTQGWLVTTTPFTITTGVVGGRAPITVAVPSDASLDATDQVTVTAVSATDPTVTDALSFRVVVTSTADLEMADEVQGNPLALVGHGQVVTYTLTMTNHGPDTATGVTMTDTLPPEMEVVSVQPTEGHCTHRHRVVHCDLDSMNPGRVVTVTLSSRVVALNSKGYVVNRAEVKADQWDPQPYNNQDVAYALLRYDLYLPVMVKVSGRAR